MRKSIYTTNPSANDLRTAMVPEQRIALGISELARRLGVSSGLVRLEIRRGNLPTIKVGQRILVQIEDLNRYLDERRSDLRGDSATKTDG